MAKIKLHRLVKTITSYLEIKRRQPAMSMTELKTKFAAESKKITKQYFDAMPPAPKPGSDKAMAAASAIRNGSFGCSTTVSSVVKLVSALLAEDLTPLVFPPQRPSLPPGAIVVFLSMKISPGNWIPELYLGGSETSGYVNLVQEGVAGGLSQEQLNSARQPSDQEIDDFFSQLSTENMAAVIRSKFGVDTLLAGCQ